MKCLLLLSPTAIALLTGNLQLMKSRSLNSRRRFFSLNSVSWLKDLIFVSTMPWLWGSWEPVLPAVTHGAEWYSLLPGVPTQGRETPNPATFCSFEVYFWSFGHGPGCLADEHRTQSKAGSVAENLHVYWGIWTQRATVRSSWKWYSDITRQDLW